LSTAYDSDSISVAGINTGSTISISGGTYRIGSGSFVSDAGTVQAGDTVTVRLTSSSSYSTLASATLTIGGVGATFGVTTKSSPASGGGGSGGYGIPIRYSVNANSSGSVIPAVTPADASGTTVTMTAGAPIVRFTDISDSFARAYIERLVASGAVSGASDTYRPEAPATRAEFLKIALVGLGIVIGTGSTSANFSDVKEAWMVPYVEKAFELGIISGQVKDGKKIFRPNDFISRAEALKIVLNAGEIAIPETKANSFSDVSESWMIPYVERALQLRIISGQTVNGKKSFRPNDSISRAEVAKIVVNVMDIPVSDR
jgi:predicted ribosomally synthesized peptide with SipW-like signal peptide